MSLVVESEWLEQVDRGAVNPHRNIPVRKPVREAKARLLGCNAIDDDDDGTYG
jgi:hypothetical protein